MLALTCFLGFFLAKAQLFSFFVVEGPSMEPTLHQGQVFVLDQFSYRFLPPTRGDVVVFSLDKDPDYYYVKRVIGLPNERVFMKGDNAYLKFQGSGEQKLNESYLEVGNSVVSDNYQSAWAKSPDNRTYSIPLDAYFVLGDNRTHSLDSRYFADHYISRNNIKGRYLFTLFSI